MVKNSLRRIRQKKNLTQASFAHILHIRPSKYAMYESNTYQPNISMVLQIAQKLDMRVEDIWEYRK